METISCVRDVVTAAGQYENNPSDVQLVQLQRQLDVRINVIFLVKIIFKWKMI